MKYLQVSFTILIFLTAYIGDYVIFQSKYSSSQLFRAVADSTVHTTIGALSALLFFSSVKITNEACFYNTVICTVVSCLIDVDHFLMAKSFYLKDVAKLKQRGILHCTTLWIVITLLLIAYSYINRKHNFYVITYMILIAFSSHHIRDGERRGLWLYPYGHTRPINKSIYLILICLLPSLLSYIYNCTKPLYKTNVFYNTNLDIV
ncbi:transmembrane protein 267 [Melitaea cinxia]|uniref:transmembrane protein 267 n=1 Tax=Melitaea cinxia TaxID=113334 RepID=UPI001E2721A7|nr:transmembrane protein 267 [Melitaea cinxia]